MLGAGVSMAADERDAERSFKVQDRRRFSADGEARDDAVPTPEPAPPPVEPTTEPPRHTGAPPALTFSTFVMSLVTQALALLGEIPDPVDGQVHVDLEAARQLIDMLGILSEKTRGNLDAGEAALLDGALYDLRMQYVDRASAR